MSAARQQAYYVEAKEANQALWDAINKLVAMQREWNALDYGTNLAAGSGGNAGLTKTEVGAVVFDSANAFVTVLNAGHATNLAKLLT